MPSTMLPAVARRRALLLLAVAVFAAGIPSTLALYEDQAGMLDWQVSNVGAVLVARSQLPKGRLVFVGSAAGVVAALHVRTGEVVWRRVLPESDGAVDGLEVTRSSVVSLSGSGTALRCWDVATGGLKWDAVLPGGSVDGDAVGLWLAGTHAAVVQRGNTLYGRRLSAAATDVWSHEVEGTVVGVTAGDANVCVASTADDSHVRVACLRASTGDEVDAYDVEVGGNPLHVVAVGVGEAVALLDVSAELQEVVVRVNGVAPAQFSIATLPPGATSAAGRLAVLPASTSAEPVAGAAVPLALHLDAGGTVVLGYAPPATGAASDDDDAVDVDVDADGESTTPSGRASGVTFAGEVFVVAALPAATTPTVLAAAATPAGTVVAALTSTQQQLRVDHLLHVSTKPHLTAGTMPSVGLPPEWSHGGPARAFLWGFTRSQSDDIILRAMVVSNDDSLSLVQQGQSVWFRPEYLASLTHVVSVDAPGRVTEHALDKLFVALARVSSGGVKLLALHSATGAVAWEQDVVAVGGGAPVSCSLHLSRAHAFDEAHNPEVMLVTKRQEVTQAAGDPERWGTRVTWVDAFSGTVLVDSLLPVVAAQLSAPPGVTDATHHQSLLVSATDGTVHLLPNTPEVVQAFDAMRASFVLRVGVVGDGVVSGHELVPVDGQPGAYTPQQLWTLNVGGNQTICAMVQPDPDEPLVAPAVVLGDDSLLTKYLNPNLVGVVSTSGEDYGSADDTMHVRLVDSVSGHVVVSKLYTHASGPIHAVRQENWLIVSYWNTKAKRTEVASVSLYDDSIGKFDLSPLKPPAEQPPFTSFAPSDPLVLTRAFVLPGAVGAMALTRTRFGITSPHVLFGLTTGVVYSLDRVLLDPRRPSGPPTDAEKREMLPQYSPFLPLVHGNVLSYNQTVHRIRHIHAAPTALESTTLVLAAGLDLFYTPATPAGAFDVLAADFNKPLLASLTLGLTVLTVVLGFLAKEKRLRARWA